MQPNQSSIPVFGETNPAIEYVPRLAAYAVITEANGAVAVVKGKSGYFLPGGGSLPSETPEQTLRREVREELVDCSGNFRTCFSANAHNHCVNIERIAKPEINLFGNFCYNPLAREIHIVRRIGEAVQYFYADERHYRMEAAFYVAEFGDEVSGTGEHELCWLYSISGSGKHVLPSVPNLGCRSGHQIALKRRAAD